MKRSIALASLIMVAIGGTAGASGPPAAKIDVIVQPAYDVRIEMAAARIVARKVGEIRGRLSSDVGAEMIAAAQLERQMQGEFETAMDEAVAQPPAGVSAETVSSIVSY